MLPTDSAERKRIPLFSGVLAYFPDALAEIAKVSYYGNDKHNTGQPLHWSRDKSTDHLDCVARHLVDSGLAERVTLSDGTTMEILHAAEMAWRALANLQILCEQRAGLASSTSPQADANRTEAVIRRAAADVGTPSRGCEPRSPMRFVGGPIAELRPTATKLD